MCIDCIRLKGFKVSLQVIPCLITFILGSIHYFKNIKSPMDNLHTQFSFFEVNDLKLGWFLLMPLASFKVLYITSRTTLPDFHFLKQISHWSQIGMVSFANSFLSLSLMVKPPIVSNQENIQQVQQHPYQMIFSVFLSSCKLHSCIIIHVNITFPTISKPLLSVG
jgi:hypothetical protein